VLAEDIHAGFDLPVFDNSTMDGFALRAEDVNDASHEQPVSLAVVADIPAGILIQACLFRARRRVL